MREIILNPLSNLKVDCPSETHVVGLYEHEKIDDPVVVKSRTSYVITASDYPVLWQSKLQSDTSLSIIEADVISVAHCCRVLLLSIMDLVPI